MKVYQMHPNHGRHIAYDHNEEQRNIENGWATVSEDEFYAEIRNKLKPAIVKPVIVKKAAKKAPIKKSKLDE